MYRFISIAIVLGWVSAMTSLFVRDVYPAWTAQDPPPMTKPQLAALIGNTQQMGLFDGQNRRCGTAWSDVSSIGGNTALRGTIYLEGLSVIPALLVESSTEFDEAGELDSFTLDVFGVPLTTIHVHGERHGIYFPCEIHVGPVFRQANLEMAASRMLGESFRPFTYLPMLQVGKAWRMQVIDPLSAALSNTTRFVPVVARVTGKETITSRNIPVECFVVETTPGQAKAWVASDGRVLKQQVQVPGFGQLTVQDEQYKDAERARVRGHLGRGSAERDSAASKAAKAIHNMRESIRQTLGGAGHDRDD